MALMYMPMYNQIINNIRHSWTCIQGPSRRHCFCANSIVNYVPKTGPYVIYAIMARCSLRSESLSILCLISTLGRIRKIYFFKQLYLTVASETTKQAINSIISKIRQNR